MLVKTCNLNFTKISNGLNKNTYGEEILVDSGETRCTHEASVSTLPDGCITFISPG